MSSLLDNIYKPDVLSCLSDLSNDEVFTPPSIANSILDLLPKEIWSNPNVKILDPAVKSGVFLREAAKRFIEGEKNIYPNLQERIDHILHEQIYGIACTELTALMSRRSVYCSKYPQGPYSITHFDNPEGNIRFKRINHIWKDEKCKYCGASKEQYDRNSELESHAYELIHTPNPEEIFNMKFDVIISNPPYQLQTVTESSTNISKQAKPIYNLFVNQAKKLNPKYLTMIIPSRWFAGGLGLDSFRSEMMNDNHITTLVDYANAKDCFPQNSISGGVCYFLRERDATGPCKFTNINGDKKITETRYLSEFPVVVRYNEAVDIIKKVISQSDSFLKDIVSPISPFAIPTKIIGKPVKDANHSFKLYSSKGVGYISESEIISNKKYINSYKVMVSQLSAEHAGEPSKEGKFRVLTTSMRVLEPTEVCTNSYIIIGNLSKKVEAENLLNYLQTKFVRFLVLQAVSSIHISKTSFTFVPNLNFNENWTDEKLYKMFNLSNEEIQFIDSMIKPIYLSGGDN